MKKSIATERTQDGSHFLCRKRTAQLSEDLAITISINIQIWLHKLNNDNWMDLKGRTTEINRKSSSSDKLLTVSIK